MKVNKYYDKTIGENFVDIHYNEIDTKINNLFTYLSENKKIIGRNEEHETVIAPCEVYYFEIVDRKCFAYMHTKTFSIDWSLQDIIDEFRMNEFRMNGFIRISKSMVINIYKLSEIKSDLNMRINAVLDNGEIVVVNRNYKKEFYRKMKELLERCNVDEINT